MLQMSHDRSKTTLADADRHNPSVGELIDDVVGGLVERLHLTSLSSGLFSLMALALVLGVLTPIRWDALWITPLAGLAAVSVQLLGATFDSTTD